ncbi:MAG: PIN domain-containing protein, partial [Gammaproteobacteria bacterium]
MYLVDTSVWIDYLKGREAAHVALLDDLLGNPLAVGISDAIYVEILQGAEDQRAFDRLRSY